jgi:outer membrane receptor protein involved in Fe transport
VGTPGADPTNERGTAYAPKYQAKFDLTWSKGPVTLNYGLAWFDKTLRTSHQNINGDPNYYAPQYVYYKELWQHDFYGAYNVTKQFQFYLGVNNAFNQKPDLGAAAYPIDSVGRFVYAGFKVRLNDLL